MLWDSVEFLNMDSDLVWIVSIVGYFFVSSFFEWALHRYVMHRPVGWFVYPFRAHAQIHHQIFKADHTYHLINPPDKETIPMAWWNGPVLVVLGSAPMALVAFIFGEWRIYVGGVISMGIYYSVYEYIHWCMHLPKERRLEATWLFRRLNAHHLLHHRYMHKNFNVVFPFADLVLGTLISRAKTRFAAPATKAITDVQPLFDGVPEEALAD